LAATLRNLVKIFLVFALLAGGISLFIAMGLVNPYWVQILQLACVVAISAQGLNIIYGYTGLFSLGHAAFYGIGAYTAAYLMKTYGGDSQAVFFVALLAGGGAAAAVAYLIGLPTLRLTSDYLGIATLGFGIIMKVIFDNADSFLPELGGARGMTGIAKMTTVPWVVFFLLVSLLIVRNTRGSTRSGTSWPASWAVAPSPGWRGGSTPTSTLSSTRATSTFSSRSTS
jgi:branched-chain amino acid transport system permease protein